ncbi:hypothetical protein C8Q79DRAFT_1106878 [Trametes meyenii]|nr:hypothetical protein C8Q79DRAFT_1106878 [Trametes meyenii]
MRKHLRIAIALAALKHKPPTQSIPAYILDLQAAFPSSCPSCSCWSTVSTGSAESPQPWRERVHALETELENLRTQHDETKMELLALRTAAQSARSRATADDICDTDSTPAPTGKKAKGKKTKSSGTAMGGPPPAPSPVPVISRRPRLELAAILQGNFAGVVDAPQRRNDLDGASSGTPYVILLCSGFTLRQSLEYYAALHEVQVGAYEVDGVVFTSAAPHTATANDPFKGV